MLIAVVANPWHKLSTIELLEKWEVPPVSEANKKLEKLGREMNKQNDTLDELR